MKIDDLPAEKKNELISVVDQSMLNLINWGW